MKKVNVGLISHDYFPIIGGQGVYVSELIKNLKLNKSVKTKIFSTTNRKNSFKITSRNNFYFSLKFNFILNGLINKYGLGMIHLQGGPGGIFLIKKPKVPAIYTVHHSYYKKSKISKNPLYKFLFFIEKLSYKKASKIIVPSRDIYFDLINAYGIDEKKIVYIPEGVDTKIFSKKNYRKIKDSLIFVGRLNKIKGLRNLIMSLKFVSKKYPSIRLYIVGEGPEIKILKKLIRRKNLKNNVKFFGKLDKEEIDKLYNQVNLSVLPSYFEGFGLSALESVASGTPVIVTKQCGVSDIIKKNNFGIVIDSNSPKEISKAILSFFKGDFKKKKLKISKNLSWKEIAKKTLEVYKNEIK